MADTQNAPRNRSELARDELLSLIPDYLGPIRNYTRFGELAYHLLYRLQELEHTTADWGEGLREESRFASDPELDKRFSPGRDLDEYSSSGIDDRSSDELSIHDNLHASATATAADVTPTKRKRAVSVDDPPPDDDGDSDDEGDAARRTKEATMNQKIDPDYNSAGQESRQSEGLEVSTDEESSN